MHAKLDNGGHFRGMWGEGRHKDWDLLVWDEKATNQQTSHSTWSCGTDMLTADQFFCVAMLHISYLVSDESLRL